MIALIVRIFGQQKAYDHLRTTEEADAMKGYYNNSGYMGYVDGKWVLFASERDYQEYMED